MIFLLYFSLIFALCSGKIPLHPGDAPSIIAASQNGNKTRIQLPVLLNFGNIYFFFNSKNIFRNKLRWAMGCRIVTFRGDSFCFGSRRRKANPSRLRFGI